MNELDRVESLLVDAVNLADAVRSIDVAETYVVTFTKAIDEALAALQTLRDEVEHPRDEAYERAAARYDGEGKDWR